MELLFKDEVYQIVGEMELKDRAIPFRSHQTIPISYKGRLLDKEYVADLICFEQIIVEMKAMEALTGEAEAQLLNYLKATGLRVGLLINFGSHGKLEWNRLVF